MINDQFRLFVLAVQFYTRVPVVGGLSRWANYAPQRLSMATRYFPLVGLFVGVMVALTYMLLAYVLPHPLAVTIAMIVGVLSTGAFHEDGWADFCDGFGGGATREHTLQIMTDSRIGAYGAIGLFLLLGLKWQALTALELEWTPIAFLCAHPFSRACAVLVMLILPYARPDDESKTKPVAQGLRRSDGIIAVLIGFAPVAAAIVWFEQYEAFALALLPGLTATVWMCRKFFRRLGGYTGDCLGATQQLAETLFYVGLVCWLTLAHSTLTHIDP